MGQEMRTNSDRQVPAAVECAGLLTADELAAALKVKLAAIRAWQLQGIPCVPVGRLRRYRLHEVLAWHAEREAARAAGRAARRAGTGAVARKQTRSARPGAEAA